MILYKQIFTVHNNIGEHMEYLKIILRMSFFYFFIILIYRLMGKREVGQLGIVDLIVSILIAELVAISVEDINKSILSSVIPIICVVILQIFLSYTSLKSGTIRNILDGSPTFIIKNGQVNYKEMVKQKYNLDDLLTQLREKGYRSIEEIEYAILENNGKLSVFGYNNKKNTTPLPMPIILDGKVQQDVVNKLNKENNFISKILNEKKLKLEDIFYAFYKDNNVFIIEYKDLN